MPKGLKASSEIIAISTSLTELVPGTMVSETIELSLSPLDNQVFVITKIDGDLSTPELIANTTTTVHSTVSTVARTTIGNIGDSNVVGSFTKNCTAAAGLTSAVAWESENPDQPSPGMDYLAVVFTSDIFVNMQGVNNVNPKTTNMRIWGYRATASPSIYAAGVQMELLG